jgi:nucleoside-diphosphate-sugar epimerase
VQILVTGAAGMIGVKLADRLARDGALGGTPIEGVTLADVVLPDPPAGAGFAVEPLAVDLAGPGSAERLLAGRPDVIFHLAAVLSAESESDFDKGYRVNLDGTRHLLDAVRAVGEGYRPRFVLASTIAVFGAPFPEAIGDEFLAAPLTSYGTQKAICELLLADWSRRDLLDGIGIRLPTICVRPGRPNLAASSFFSSIIREPLNGREAILPVADDVRHWHASPRAAVGFLLHAATIDTHLLGDRRSLSMPGVSATVADQIASLGRVGGTAATRLIRREPDEAIASIVAGWPRRFDTRRALALGFRAERDFDEIVGVYLEDDLERPEPGP